MIQKCLSLNSIHFIDVIYNAFAIMYHGILSTAEWYAFWYICTPLYTFQHIAIIFRNYIWNPCGMHKAAHLSYHHYYNNLISILFQSSFTYLVFETNFVCLIIWKSIFQNLSKIIVLKTKYILGSVWLTKLTVFA